MKHRRPTWAASAAVERVPGQAASTSEAGKMRLHPREKDIVQNWLKERHIAHCPACGLSDFHVGEVTDPPAMVQVICGNCALILLFQAAAIGLNYGAGL